MNFQELCDEVALIVRRPDLLPRIQAAVRAATLKAHQSDFYYRDIVEASISFDEPRHIQNFNAYSVLPNFRKAKYLRQWHEDGQQAGTFYEPIQIEDVFDRYGYTKNNVFYLAGQLIQVRSAVPVNKLLFGCYVHPLVGESNYSSWIASEVPYAIVYDAVRNVCKSIALDNEAAQYDRLTAEQYASLRMSYIDDTPWT